MASSDADRRDKEESHGAAANEEEDTGAQIAPIIKLEEIAVTTGEEEEEEEDLFTSLGLHFKTLDMATGDLGAPAYRKFDIEAWMPGLGRYGEISSASNCTDYQSRRLGIRYRPSPSDPSPQSNSKKGKGSSSSATHFVHTLNATACAVPRMIVCLLENFQQEDGSVLIPEPLRPFTGALEVLSPKGQ